LAVGAAFIAVWFTKASDLWAKSEDLWEGLYLSVITHYYPHHLATSGIFELIAAIMIFVMGITMLKMDRAKTKWRIKLQRAFDGKS
jgi:high-affinity iron transporter